MFFGGGWHVLKSWTAILMFMGEIESCVNHASNEYGGSNDVGIWGVKVQLLVWYYFLVPKLTCTMQSVCLGGHFVVDEILDNVVQ